MRNIFLLVVAFVAVSNLQLSAQVIDSAAPSYGEAITGAVLSIESIPAPAVIAASSNDCDGLADHQKNLAKIFGEDSESLIQDKRNTWLKLRGGDEKEDVKDAIDLGDIEHWIGAGWKKQVTKEPFFGIFKEVEAIEKQIDLIVGQAPTKASITKLSELALKLEELRGETNLKQIRHINAKANDAEEEGVDAEIAADKNNLPLKNTDYFKAWEEYSNAIELMARLSGLQDEIEEEHSCDDLEPADRIESPRDELEKGDDLIEVWKEDLSVVREENLKQRLQQNIDTALSGLHGAQCKIASCLWEDASSQSTCSQIRQAAADALMQVSIRGESASSVGGTQFATKYIKDFGQSNPDMFLESLYKARFVAKKENNDFDQSELALILTDLISTTTNRQDFYFRKKLICYFSETLVKKAFAGAKPVAHYQLIDDYLRYLQSQGNSKSKEIVDHSCQMRVQDFQFELPDGFDVLDEGLIKKISKARNSLASAMPKSATSAGGAAVEGE